MSWPTFAPAGHAVESGEPTRAATSHAGAELPSIPVAGRHETAVRQGLGAGGTPQMARGSARVSGQPLKAGDGVALSDEPRVELEGTADAEVLLFDLA